MYHYLSRHSLVGLRLIALSQVLFQLTVIQCLYNEKTSKSDIAKKKSILLAKALALQG